LKQGSKSNSYYLTTMSAPALDQYFISDTSRITGEIEKISRVKGRVSALMKKGTIPNGIGFNFSSVITNRSRKKDGGWVNVSTPSLEGVNNCTPVPSTVSPSRTQYSYSARQTAIFSNDICFTDARAGYKFEQQVAQDRENFVAEIVDTWEDEDKAQFINAAGHKVILGPGTESSFGAAIPNVAATSTLNQVQLNALYQQIIQDGGGNEPYAQKNGAPLLPLIVSFEGSQIIQQGAQDVREDIRFAEQGMGEAARLMQSWSVDRAFGGFMHIIDVRMPRYDFANGEYVERSFYADDNSSTIGEEAVVNPAYINAGYEAAFIWHPDVIHREVPAPLGSVGSDTRGTAWNFNGEVQWLNIPDKTLNPFSDIGFWAARLNAAYRPIKPRYGYVLIYKRCPNIPSTDCPSYT